MLSAVQVINYYYFVRLYILFYSLGSHKMKVSTLGNLCSNFNCSADITDACTDISGTPCCCVNSCDNITAQSTILLDSFPGYKLLVNPWLCPINTLC